MVHTVDPPGVHSSGNRSIEHAGDRVGRGGRRESRGGRRARSRGGRGSSRSSRRSTRGSARTPAGFSLRSARLVVARSRRQPGSASEARARSSPRRLSLPCVIRTSCTKVRGTSGSLTGRHPGPGARLGGKREDGSRVGRDGYPWYGTTHGSRASSLFLSLSFGRGALSLSTAITSKSPL